MKVDINKSTPVNFDTIEFFTLLKDIDANVAIKIIKLIICLSKTLIKKPNKNLVSNK